MPLCLTEGITMFFFKLSNSLNKPLRNRISRSRNPNQKKYLKIRQLKQAGFTLIELMIAVTLTSFISLAISSVFIFSVEQFHILMQQHKTEESMLFASYHIRSYLSQAVNMHLVGAVGTPECNIEQGDIISNNQGFIVEYDYNNKTPTTTCRSSVPPDTSLVALFPRENSFQYNSVDLFETSIFYEHPTVPTATQSSRPGRLMFGLGTRANGDTGFFHSPQSPNNIIYTGLSHFGISIENEDIKDVNGICNDTDCLTSKPMVKKVQVRLTFRYFLFTAGSGGNFYDYVSDIREVNAKEVENTIDINFHNNTMAKCEEIETGCDKNTHPTGKERIFGPIYFYKLVIPAGILNF